MLSDSCHSMNFSLSGSSVYGILQARMLEWVAISSSRRSFWPRDQICIFCVSCIYRWILLPLNHLESPLKNEDYELKQPALSQVKQTESENESHSVVSDSLQPYGLYSPWNSPGQNTGVGSLSLLRGIFLTQELNRDLLHCRQILYQLNYEGSSKT